MPLKSLSGGGGGGLILNRQRELYTYKNICSVTGYNLLLSLRPSVFKTFPHADMIQLLSTLLFIAWLLRIEVTYLFDC